MSLGWFNLYFKRCYVFNIACIFSEVFTDNSLSEMVYMLAWIDFHMLLGKSVKSHYFKNESSFLMNPVTFFAWIIGCLFTLELLLKQNVW